MSALILQGFENDPHNPLYKKPEEKLSEKEYVTWLIENDPRCPLFTAKEENNLIKSGKFEAELVELYKLLELEEEKGALMSKSDKMKLRLMKNIAMKRSSTRGIMYFKEEQIKKNRDAKKKEIDKRDPVEVLHSKFIKNFKL